MVISARLPPLTADILEDMTTPPSHAPSRPDLRLIQLHAERGNPIRRVATALAELEKRDWGLLLADETALAQQLAQLIGTGMLRVDGRLGVDRQIFAEAGLAITHLYGDWTGARAVWLFQPTPEQLDQAKQAGVTVLIDATLCPSTSEDTDGYVIYRNAHTLSGQGDLSFSAILGKGNFPPVIARVPSDLTISLLIRDMTTLSLRLSKIAKLTSDLRSTLGGIALDAGPTALLLPPHATKVTDTPLGGVLMSVRSVPDGLMLTPGLERLEDILSRLALPHKTSPSTNTEKPTTPEKPSDNTTKATTPQQQERPVSRHPQQQQQYQLRQDQKRYAPPRPSQPDVPRFPQLRPQPVRTELVTSPITETTPTAKIVTESSPETLENIVAAVLRSEALEVKQQVPQPESKSQTPNLPSFNQTQTKKTPPASTQPKQSSPTPKPQPIPLEPDLPTKGEVLPELTPEQSVIFNRLRDWRNTEAKERNVSRFIVASNVTLCEIAQQAPYTLEELTDIRGMGKARVARYGEQILRVVKNES